MVGWWRRVLVTGRMDRPVVRRWRSPGPGGFGLVSDASSPRCCLVSCLAP